MITKEILESHSVTVLKKELSKTNIKGYSKMKKSEVVALMLKPEHSQRFSHIVKKGEAPKPEKKIVIKRTPKPEKKIVIKRTPKPEKKIVIKRTPKSEKKIVIKRTPAKKIKIIKDKKEPVKKNVIKTEKKIVIKKPRRETPGSIEAKRIKKRIKIEKGKAPIEEIRQLYQKDPVINEGFITYPNKKGEMMRIRLPKFDEVFLKTPLRELGKDREDFLKGKYLLKKIGGGLYKSFTEKEVKRIFPENSANAIINYSDKYRKKIIFRREQKKKTKAPSPAPAPAPAKKEKKYDFNFMKKIKFSRNSSENNRATENAIRKNFTKIEIKKMCDVLYKNKNSKEFYKMTKNLEGESYEELVESNILEICEEEDFEEKRKAPAKKSTLDNINDKADKKIDAKIKRDEKSFLKMLDKILK